MSVATSARTTVAKIAQRGFALGLRAIRVDPVDAMLTRFENVGNSLRATTSARENEHTLECLGIFLKQSEQEGRLRFERD
jgi:hypothetical protein